MHSNPIDSAYKHSITAPLVGSSKSAGVSLKFFASLSFISTLLMGEHLSKMSKHGLRKSLFVGNGCAIFTKY